MTYRSRTDIISEILEAANGGVTQTKIMYKALLNYAQMKQYLMVLTHNDLLSYDLDTRTFKTTEKGLRYLYTYNQMYDMIKAT
jgi:predicted transcriptional regulator